MAQLNTQSKNRLKIFGIVLGVLLLVVGVATGVALNTTKGKEIVQEAQEPFKPVELPASSRDLTKVPEAPKQKKDSSNDKFINVDMRGKKIVQNNTNDGNDYAVDETPSSSHRSAPGAPAAPTPGSPSGNNSNAPATHRSPTAEEMNQVSNTGVRFVAPTIGLDVPLGELDEVNGVIKPTNYTAMFAIRNKGVKYTETNKGTAYFAAHALDDGIAPGNFLLDSATRTPRIHEGDVFTVGNVKFRVTKTERVGKGLVGTDKNIWDSSQKNRAVVITCFPSSNDNFVTFAQRV